jgi:hypothetical protein
MLRDAAVDIIAKRLGQRSGLDAQILAEMKLKQIALERSPFLPWFLVQCTSFSCGIGQEYAQPAATFLREVDAGSLWIQATDGAWSVLNKDDFDQLVAYFGVTYPLTTGYPTHYALLFNIVSKFYLFPVPDANYGMRLWAFMQDAVLETNIENNWLKYAPDLLISETGMVMARFLRDEAAVKLFNDDRKEALARLMADNEARIQAAMSVVLGG